MEAVAQSPAAVEVAHNSPRQPDINYQPDLEKYKQRTQRRLQGERLADSLPIGFPAKLDSPLVWSTADLEPDAWVSRLTAADQDEIVSALRLFRGQISLRSFRLSSSVLSPRRRAIRPSLYLPTSGHPDLCPD